MRNKMAGPLKLIEDLQVVYNDADSWKKCESMETTSAALEARAYVLNSINKLDKIVKAIMSDTRFQKDRE